MNVDPATWAARWASSYSPEVIWRYVTESPPEPPPCPKRANGDFSEGRRDAIAGTVKRGGSREYRAGVRSWTG